MHHRMTPRSDEKENHVKWSVFECFNRQVTTNNKDTLNHRRCNNKEIPTTADWRRARLARGLQRRIQSHIKDTQQYCNPRLWSREHKLGQMGRRVSVVRFRPPLHYNAWWAGRKIATAALRVKQTDAEGENDTVRLRAHFHLFTNTITRCER